MTGGCVSFCRLSFVVCQNHRSCTFTVSPGTYRTGDRHRHANLLAGDETGDDHGQAEGARRKAASDRHLGLDGHIGDIGILAGLDDFTENEERATGLDLDGDVRLADEALTQLVAIRRESSSVVAPRANTEPMSGTAMWPLASTA